MSLVESEEGIVGSLTYATALFEHATVRSDGWAIGGICWMRW
ncbi:hypothetical protein [Xanthomonas sp. MUS 060]|nr:hypothetical protein [Xanthomonas sp. MUS 060]